jgi:glycosyltransferase involved in cell wall biosynthesis
MKPRIKVMQLSASLAIGGAERMILSLAKEIDRARFEVHVCGMHPAEHDFKHAIDDLDVPLHILRTKRFYDPRTIRAITQYVRQQEIDVIHTHVLDADVAGHLAGRLTIRPVITTLHSVPFSYDRQRPTRRWLQRFTVRYMAANLVTVSNTAEAQFIDQWKIPAGRIRTIHPAVALDPFLAVPEGVPIRGPDEPLTVTTVGRLVPAKAQHLLIEAASRIARQGLNARFTIVGPGQREGELRQLANELGVADHVTFAGARHDIPAILSQTDVFALTSMWEGLPLSAIEAMAAARPVVLTDVGGCRELVEDGVNGLVVSPGNSQAIADAIVSLLGDAQRRRRYGQAARERVRGVFDVARLAQEYEALYSSVHAHAQPPLLGRFRPA